MKRFALLITLLWALIPAQVMASGLDSPQGPVLLTVSGEVTVVNGDGAAVFDRSMLEALDWQEIRTHTAFTEGEQTFAGPTLASVLAAVGAQGATLMASAINDYTVEIPAAHADAHDVLLAMEHNGAAMRVRDKGPIWIVYPQTPEEVEANIFNAEMIWQLASIRIE